MNSKRHLIYHFSRMNFLIIVVMVHNVLQISRSPNIFLTKYQLSFFFCLLFAEKIDFLLVNQQINSQLKLVLRRCKQNLVKKIFGESRNFGGSDPTNELHVTYFARFAKYKSYLFLVKQGWMKNSIC